MADVYEIDAKLPDGESIRLEVDKACRLIKEIVLLKTPRASNKFKSAYGAAWKHLRDAGIETVPLDPERLKKFISKPYRQIRAEEGYFISRALSEYFFPGLEPAKIRAMAAALETRAEKNTPRPADVFDLAKALGITANSQERLHELAGEYFIFRRVFTRPAFNVSLLTITPPRHNGAPAAFQTIGSRHGGYVREPPIVNGAIWYPNDTRFVCAIGRIDGSSEIRTSTLLPVSKPIRDPVGPQDLIGIRLGMGMIHRVPRAYRIWCARLVSPPPPEGWRSFVRDYRDDEISRVFAPHVPGLDHIIGYLNQKYYVEIDYEGDGMGAAESFDISTNS